MNQSIFVSISLVFLAAYPVLGNPMITINTQYMLNTDVERRIPIYVSSSAEEVEGLNLAVQIGDGGTANGGVNSAPRITNLDVIGPGTLFNASNTGSTPLYLGSGDNPPYLIALADTTTDQINSLPSLEANGVLAYLTVNPSGASIGLYQIHLLNVGAGATNGPRDTDFAGIPASFSGDFYINIVNVHQMKWNAGASGAWTNSTWTGSPPTYPNYTAQAIVDTQYTVAVSAAEEADSLDVSAGGAVSVESTGSLTVTNGVTLATSGTIELAGGAELTAASILLTNGTVAGNGTIDAGTITVGNGVTASTLTADSVTANTLTIAAGSKVTINPILSGAPLAGSTALTVVPEPSTVALLIAAALGMFLYRKIR